ncbi:hypothetical protein KCU73_g64, partial [Aureobasidium melanogenum]
MPVAPTALAIWVLATALLLSSALKNVVQPSGDRRSQECGGAILSEENNLDASSTEWNQSQKPLELDWMSCNRSRKHACQNGNLRRYGSDSSNVSADRETDGTTNDVSGMVGGFEDRAEGWGLLIFKQFVTFVEQRHAGFSVCWAWVERPRLRVQSERHGWVWEQRGPSVEDEKRKTMLLRQRFWSLPTRDPSHTLSRIGTSNLHAIQATSTPALTSVCAAAGLLITRLPLLHTSLVAMAASLDYPAQQFNVHRRPVPSTAPAMDYLAHSRTRTISSNVVPPQPYSQPPHPPPLNQSRRTLSNATTSTTSTHSSVHGRVPAAPSSYASSIRRSTSSRSNNSPSSYVSLMRKQKATVWCDRAQLEDPRMLAQQRAAKMRAQMEVVGGVSATGNNRSSGSSGGIASKIRHHGAVKASAYSAAGNLSGAGVPMPLLLATTNVTTLVAAVWVQAVTCAKATMLVPHPLPLASAMVVLHLATTVTALSTSTRSRANARTRSLPLAHTLMPHPNKVLLGTTISTILVVMADLVDLFKKSDPLEMWEVCPLVRLSPTTMTNKRRMMSCADEAASMTAQPP